MHLSATRIWRIGTCVNEINRLHSVLRVCCVPAPPVSFYREKKAWGARERSGPPHWLLDMTPVGHATTFRQ